MFLLVLGPFSGRNFGRGRVKKLRNFHDPWVGTDTTGPGEAVSAIGGANFEGIT